MNTKHLNSLELNRPGLRFIDPTVEKAYRAWRLDLTAQLIKWVHIAAWVMNLSVLMLPYFTHREFFSLFAPYWASIFVPSYTTAVVLSFLPFWKHWALPTLVVLQMIGGCGGMWALQQSGASAQAMVTWAAIITMFVPFMRIPPGVAVIAIAPALGFATFTAITTTIAGSTNLVDSAFLLTGPPTIFLFVITMCLMIDFFSRQTFIKDQIIEQQQKGLEHSQSVIRRYVPPRVADRIISGDEATIEKPQRLRVTVLFADIVGFTDIADRVEPEVMTEVLNDYMSTMAELIESHGGTLNEFAGDGLMAMFGAPDTLSPEDQSLKAVKAALAMQAAMPKLNDQWIKLGIGTELQTRIGINTGMASVGSYGSEGRRTYTAIGLQTNIASRIESAAEPGQILISDATYQLISEDIDCEPRGDVECKGVHFPVKVYAPRGLR